VGQARATPGDSAEVLRPDFDEATSRVGGRLREVRGRRGLSLRDTAGRAGISAAFLSQVENHKSQPSVSTLYSLCSVLDTTPDELFGFSTNQTGPGRSDRRSAPVEVVRHDERARLRLASGVTWERLATAGAPNVDCLFVTYDVGGASTQDETRIRHGGTEFGVVLAGSLRIELDFDDVVLEAGDSVSFDSTHPHRLSTVGDEPAVAVWFVVDRDEARGARR
jgi:transcriptional regulator with XRE-family HTH domain